MSSLESIVSAAKTTDQRTAKEKAPVQPCQPIRRASCDKRKPDDHQGLPEQSQSGSPKLGVEVSTVQLSLVLLFLGSFTFSSRLTVEMPIQYFVDYYSHRLKICRFCVSPSFDLSVSSMYPIPIPDFNKVTAEN
ncbi:hypothetical protein AFLA_013413 [Aspergillus flavus NRRL3357]|nr:hypothetical protein AFLA_013413 [Aspergillus flavus NRRL3357]